VNVAFDVKPVVCAYAKVTINLVVFLDLHRPVKAASF
jgi:hypothetical protein